MPLTTANLLIFAASLNARCQVDTDRTKVPYTAVGSAGKITFGYVIRRLNALSAGPEKPVEGLNLR